MVAEKLYRCTCGFESDGVSHLEPHPEILDGSSKHVMRRTDVSYTIPTDFSEAMKGLANIKIEYSFDGNKTWQRLDLPPGTVDPMTDTDDDFYRSPSER